MTHSKLRNNANKTVNIVVETSFSPNLLLMPFVPLIVNILMYFAGYSPLQRHRLFEALPKDTRFKLVENDVALSSYAFPMGRCPLKYETLSILTKILGDDLCNPSYHGHDICIGINAKHRQLLDALSVGVNNAFDQCQAGSGSGDNLLFMYLEPIPKLLELMLESISASIAGTIAYTVPREERACIGHTAQLIAGLYRAVVMKTSTRFLDYPWTYKSDDRHWQTIAGSAEAEFIQNIIEGSFPSVRKCRSWSRETTFRKDRGKRIIYLINQCEYYYINDFYLGSCT